MSTLVVPAIPDSIAVIRQTVSGICEALGADRARRRRHQAGRDGGLHERRPARLRGAGRRHDRARRAHGGRRAAAARARPRERDDAGAAGARGSGLGLPLIAALTTRADDRRGRGRRYRGEHDLRPARPADPSRERRLVPRRDRLRPAPAARARSPAGSARGARRPLGRPPQRPRAWWVTPSAPRRPTTSSNGHLDVDRDAHRRRARYQLRPLRAGRRGARPARRRPAGRRRSLRRRRQAGRRRARRARPSASILRIDR